MHASDTWAVVVAAGRGERFAQPYNKVFHPLNGRSVLSRCLDALAAADAFGGIVLVLSEADFLAYEQLVQREGRNPLVKLVVSGGASRRESVFNGLSALPEDAQIVAVHDAARPFVAKAVIRACIDSAREHGSGVPAVPVMDTIKQVDDQGCAVDTLARDRLRAVQTPQVFKRHLLVKAHTHQPDEPATDDASLYERAVGPVHLVMLPECEDNIKITTPRDARRLEQPSGFRMGTGYDVHRLVEGRPLVLCGVTVPFERGLLGHSDADVAAHALMDAMLGAMALGDIGRHFPDSDPQYLNVSSMILVERVAAMARERGFVLQNADLTIVAQRPKLMAYIGEMAARMANALNVRSTRLNIKATTTEGLGFEGEGLGISAQAVVLMAGNGEHT